MPGIPESMIVHGVDVIYRERSKVWVAVFGPDYCVHFKQPNGQKWVGRKFAALEPIAVSDDLLDCVKLAKKHYDAYQRDVAMRIQQRLRNP